MSLPFATILIYFGWAAGILFGIIALIVLVCIPLEVRIWRVGRIYKSLPNEVKLQVLGLIEDAARTCPSVTFLRLDEVGPCDRTDTLLESHVGGVPYAEAGDQWPAGKPEGQSAKFPIQVRLGEPSLGETWQGRLITVFLVFDVKQIVRSYAAPSLAKYVPLRSSEPSLPCVRLTSLRLPVEAADDKTPASPQRLCEQIPELTGLLGRYTKDRIGLLSLILRPNVSGYGPEYWHIAYVGGDPTCVQEPHEPACDVCRKPMRFLFKFGGIVPVLPLADTGVICVYGCDGHPDHCKGFLDLTSRPPGYPISGI